MSVEDAEIQSGDKSGRTLTRSDRIQSDGNILKMLRLTTLVPDRLFLTSFYIARFASSSDRMRSDRICIRCTVTTSHK